MKKIVVFILCTLALLTLVVPFVAIAEEATGTETTVISETVTEQPNTPYTWEYLATLAGATAATLLIVQFLKVPLDKVWKIPTRVFVYIVALAILLIATAFTTGLTLQNAPLAAVNAFIVALTAYGTYEVTFAKLNQ